MTTTIPPVTSALTLAQITKQYGGVQVLNGVTFSLQPGERAAVIGPNGAGKSTLLNVITGVTPPSSGTIRLFDGDITHLAPYRRLKLGMGCGFQLNRLFYGLTVLENVQLAISGAGSLREKSLRISAPGREKARELLTAMDLWNRRDDQVGTIAYGEQRRLEIIFALASSPRLLILDEPTAGLALAEIAPFMSAIRSLALETAILFTSHDMDVVFGLANRLIVLYFGEVIADDTADAVQANERVRAIYLGEK
ncbi:MAG: ABC transporter ATP-binding protein [bacterium]|nr:ABC transporter ATP-binding protein [bacterium]